MDDVKSRTVDNMGFEAHVRYARSQEALQQEGVGVTLPGGTDTSVVTPYRPPEFQEYFAPEVTKWAFFSLPPTDLTRPLFTHQVVPTLGDSEENKERLEAVKVSTPEEEKQMKILGRLLQTVEDLDRILSKIDARRNEYHKG